MSNQVIPNTDNIEVAGLAAALYLAEARPTADDSFEKRLDRFRRAYETVVDVLGESPEIFVTLPQPEVETPPPPPRPPLPTFDE
jgi:alkanesulfonate monooxygenase SsuD/methylene tetrahydromethanopterin reductase-like flavin-dependent oxidoreductase (luciferase family)